jgi:uncharacterized protein
MLTNSGNFIIVLTAMMATFSAVVVYIRFKTKIMYGDGGNMTLIRSRAVHFNLLENGIPFLILLISFDILGGSRNNIIGVGSIFILARLIHAISTYWLRPDHLFRAIGYSISHLAQVYLMVKIWMILCEKAQAIA